VRRKREGTIPSQAVPLALAVRGRSLCELQAGKRGQLTVSTHALGLLSVMDRATIIKEALTQAEDSLEETESELAELHERAQRLKAEIHGLRLALAAHEQPQKETLFTRLLNGAANVGVAFLTLEEWRRLPRTEAVTRVFAETGFEPLHRKVVTDMLHAKGRDDDIKDVSAALAYLKREGRAESLGNGQWLVPPKSLNQPLLVTGDSDVEHVLEEEAGDL
jgi:hypothetical protein